MNARRPISFLATIDPEQAERFYKDLLGLKLLEKSPYALVFADGDTMLRIQIVAKLISASYTVHGWHVEDINVEVEKLSLKGVIFLNFNGLEQNVRGVWTTPDGNKIAWFKDPCENILSLTQFS